MATANAPPCVVCDRCDEALGLVLCMPGPNIVVKIPVDCLVGLDKMSPGPR